MSQIFHYRGDFPHCVILAGEEGEVLDPAPDQIHGQIHFGQSLMKLYLSIFVIVP